MQVEGGRARVTVKGHESGDRPRALCLDARHTLAAAASLRMPSGTMAFGATAFQAHEPPWQNWAEIWAPRGQGSTRDNPLGPGSSHTLEQSGHPSMTSERRLGPGHELSARAPACLP